MPTAKTSLRYNLVSALLAFVMWGGWAYLVNRHAADGSVWVSALTQGVCSFVITLIIVRAVTWVYHRLRGHWLRVILPPVFTISATGSLLVMAHWFAGTAEVVTTVAAPLGVGFAFALFTTVRLDQQRKESTR